MEKFEKFLCIKDTCIFIGVKVPLYKGHYYDLNIEGLLHITNFDSDNELINQDYFNEHFISIKEYRKQKLQKLNDNKQN